MEMFIGIAFVLVLLYSIFFVPIGMLCIRTYKVTKGESKVPFQVGVLSFLPFTNVIYLRKMLYGKSTLFIVLHFVLLAIFLFRVVAIVLISTAPILVVYSSILMLAGLGVFYLMYVANAIDISHMLDSGFVQYLASTIIPPLAVYFLSLKIVPYFSDVKEDLNGTFSGNNTSR